MTKSIFDVIKRDKAEGTQGDWAADPDHQSEVNAPNGLTVATCWFEDAVGVRLIVNGINPVSSRESKANARRVSRLPALEDVALAAEAMAIEAELLLAEDSRMDSVIEAFNTALARLKKY